MGESKMRKQLPNHECKPLLMQDGFNYWWSIIITGVCLALLFIVFSSKPSLPQFEYECVQSHDEANLNVPLRSVSIINNDTIANVSFGHNNTYVIKTIKYLRDGFSLTVFTEYASKTICDRYGVFINASEMEQ